jgi:hypothetical protein
MVERCNDGNFCILGDIGILVLNDIRRTKATKFTEELPEGLLTIVQESLKRVHVTTCCVVWTIARYPYTKLIE